MASGRATSRSGEGPSFRRTASRERAAIPKMESRRLSGPRTPMRGRSVSAGASGEGGPCQACRGPAQGLLGGQTGRLADLGRAEMLPSKVPALRGEVRVRAAAIKTAAAKSAVYPKGRP